MPTIRVDHRCLSARLVLFDKDGTLLAFHVLWQAWFNALRRDLLSHLGPCPDFEASLPVALGYDPDSGAWDPAGPLTLASTSELGILMAGLVYRYRGHTWDAALDLVASAEERARALIAADDTLLQPIGDARGLIMRLKEVGFLVAVATTDNRASSESGLQELGILPLLDALVCADDGLPLKPEPDMALHVCKMLDVPPREAIMVGDSTVDMIMARRAGFARVIAVTSGAMGSEDLAPHADLVIPDIHALHVPEE